MNQKTILEKIFGNNCILTPRYTNKKFISSNEDELFKVICTGYIKKKDVDNLNDLKNYSELHIISK